MHSLVLPKTISDIGTVIILRNKMLRKMVFWRLFWKEARLHTASPSFTPKCGKILIFHCSGTENIIKFFWCWIRNEGRDVKFILLAASVTLLPHFVLWNALLPLIPPRSISQHSVALLCFCSDFVNELGEIWHFSRKWEEMVSTPKFKEPFWFLAKKVLRTVVNHPFVVPINCGEYLIVYQLNFSSNQSAFIVVPNRLHCRNELQNAQRSVDFNVLLQIFHGIGICCFGDNTFQQPTGLSTNKYLSRSFAFKVLLIDLRVLIHKRTF